MDGSESGPSAPSGNDMCLRINLPLDREGRCRREYRIRFDSEDAFQEAMSRLAPSTWFRIHRSNIVKSGWLCEAPAQDESEEGKIRAKRQEALDILDGIHNPPPYSDWEGCRYESYFNYMTSLEERSKATAMARQAQSPRRGLLQGLGPEGERVSFSWKYLHRVLAGGLSEADLAHFPAWDKALEPTLLFVRAEDQSEVQRVQLCEALNRRSVFEFRKLMLDVALRGWRDVIWLSWPNEQLPRGLRPGESVTMQWPRRTA